MKIIKSKKYEKDYKKKILNKYKQKEINRIQNIEELVLDSENLKSLLLNPLSLVYNIRQKEGVLKEIFTAYENSKIRLYMKPIGEYPYNKIEIKSIEFLKIDVKHYGEG